MLEGFLTVGRAITDHNRHRLLTGDSLHVLKDFADNSVDACVTDPPYGLSNHKTQDVVACLTAWLQNEPFKPKKGGFMGMGWDSWVPGPEIWREVYRVLKPGGHALVFAGTRSMDLMCMALRLAGFEVRDSIGFAHDDTRDAAPLLGWTFGSGFPKSQDVSKAIDKALGAKRVITRAAKQDGARPRGVIPFDARQSRWRERRDIAATLDAEKWEGFGTCLKPAWEPVILVRKPLGEKTVARNVLKHGTGALNIDGCRIGTTGATKRSGQASYAASGWRTGHQIIALRKGRFPANLIHDGSAAVTSLFPTTGPSKVGVRDPNGSMGYHGGASGLPGVVSGHADNGGSAARFFYCAKASSKDRNEGLDHLPTVESVYPGANSFDEDGNRLRKDGSVIPPLKAKNFHSTVKPTALMRYLVRLVTPPGGLVLDPFAGSGSTGKAAVLEGFDFVGIEQSSEYARIARERIRAARKAKGRRA